LCATGYFVGNADGRKLSSASVFKGDQLTDSTRVWPDSRSVPTLGKLTIDKGEAAAGGSCDKVTFNPLVLATGIKPSADPVLLARPAPYGISLGRRLTEAAK
jgi:catalase